MASKPDFSVEDLREWQKDPNGKVFWEEIRRLFADRVSLMRQEVRSGKTVESAVSEGFCEGMEEVLQLPDLIIEEYVQDKKEKETHGISN